MTVQVKDARPVWRRRTARAGAALAAGMATGFAVAALALDRAALDLAVAALDAALGHGAGAVALGLLAGLSPAQEALVLGAALVGAMVPGLVMKAVGMTAADIFRDRWQAGGQVR